MEISDGNMVLGWWRWCVLFERRLDWGRSLCSGAFLLLLLPSRLHVTTTTTNTFHLQFDHEASRSADQAN